jgi:hypothetical protein
MENEFAVLLDSQVKAINDDTRVKKLFPKALMSSQDKTAIKKYGPKIYSYLKKKLIDSFGYDIDGGITIVGDELIQNKILGIPIRIQNSVNESRLIIDAYNGVVPVPVSEKSKVKRTVNLNETLSKKIEFNLNNIRKYKFNTIETKVGTLYSSVEIEFPLVLKVQNQKNKYLDEGVSKYYMLVKVYTSNPIEGDEFIGKDNSIVTGNRAEYIEISTKGSNQQWAGGFMFNTDVFERPSYKTVREFVAQKQIEEGGVNSALTLAGVNFDDLNDDLFDNLDFSTSPALQKGNITANEKEVTVNGVNIADVSDDMFDDLDDSNPPSVSTQLSTSVTLKAVASIPQNLVSGIEAFGTKQEANAEAKKLLGNSPHSIDMVEAGIRTRTTRSVGEMDKYNVKVGDIIKQFGKSADGTTKNILTRVTAIHPKGTPGFLGTWNKEGWTQEGIKAIERYKDGAAAIEFEVVNKSTQPSTSVEREYTPENITSLKPNEVFVFGSNAEGVHGKGAALLAKQKFGAKQGQSEGLQGQSYAVITKKNWRVEKSSSLEEIKQQLDTFLDYAANDNNKFFVTKLGSSLAGYTTEEIKQLFRELHNENPITDNVILPKEYEVRTTVQPSTSVKEGVPELFDSEENILVQNATSIPNPILDLLGLNTNTASYPELTSFWNENIEGNSEYKNILKKQNIVDLKSLEKAYENHKSKNEEDFIEYLNTCIKGLK